MTTQIQATYSLHPQRPFAGIFTMVFAGSLVIALSGFTTDSTNDGYHQSNTSQHSAAINMFGGASYQGAPALTVTAALVEAGGGSGKFSFAKALVSMLGEDTVNAEVTKLTNQYGEADLKTFLGGMDLAITLSLKHLTQAGIALPETALLTGVELAKTLVGAGTTPDGTFWSGYLFDKAVSDKIHQQVMVDINESAGYEADLTTHKILNQAMYDVAQALGMKDVKLASLH
ncbi:hypothetical protein [Zhongshania marina]|uniref:DUF4197 domain-containing protein n=1 Tax=Zhongshania marina TaxID=2304603 RepID=A0A2S4HE96_9GAMM|nr:hypothetical protein [Marortus luteolus]POP52290.1 hypothetical protein C0068_13010 [Marortus luteolus]